MPVLDFPASPITGDKYPVTAVPGQPQYTYDGVKWTTIGAQISNAAPATALPLMDAATAVVGTATKYAREDHVHPRIPAAPVDALGWSGMQINGSLEVSQERGNVNTQLNATYPIDGWITYFSTGIGLAVGQGTGSPSGFPNILYMQCQTAKPSLLAADAASIVQYIEGYRISRLGWGTANAQPITIGFWTAHAKPGLYSGNVRPSSGDPSYVFAYTQAAAHAWQYNTVTIPGCTTGTWAANNTIGIILQFIMATGSAGIAPSINAWVTGNYAAAPGQVNAVDSTANACRFAGVVVLPGIAAPTAAQSPLIMRPFDQELLTCKRYWEKYYIRLDGYGLAGTSIITSLAYAVEKRAAPTVTYTGTSMTNSAGPQTVLGSAHELVWGINATATGMASGVGTMIADARL